MNGLIEKFKALSTLRRLVLSVLFLLVLAGIAYWLLKCVHPFGIEGWMVRKEGRQLFDKIYDKLFAKIIFNPLFYVGVGFILFLEKIRPAKPDQKIFSLGLMQDATYLIFEAFFQITVITTYVYLMTSIYNEHFSYLTITPLEGYPISIRFLFGVLLLDFLDWFHHWLRHVVPWFWQLHTVHHSQKELNMFTDARYHFIEYIIAKTVNVLPFLMLGIDVPTIVYWVIFKMWYTRHYHGNIKANYGFLKYVLVTPQSHRIHHSIEKHHQDKNFGVLLSIWDHMFKTQYCGYDEYPDTGIADEVFPHEKTAKGLHLITTPLIQLVYPLRVIGRSIKNNLVRTG